MAWTDRTRSTERDRGQRVEIRLSGSVREFGGGRGKPLSPLENYVPQDAKIDKEDVELLVARAKEHASVFLKKRSQNPLGHLKFSVFGVNSDRICFGGFSCIFLYFLGFFVVFLCFS